MPKTNATSYARKIYTNIPLRSAAKNKANQTQFQPQSELVQNTQLAALVTPEIATALGTS